jgi:hypothetical protein
MPGLESQFPGDKAWESYVEAVSPAWKDCSIQDELLSRVNGDLGLAKAIHWHLQRDALAWFERVLGALDEETPRRCTESETGVRRLKSMLMRMP